MTVETAITGLPELGAALKARRAALGWSLNEASRQSGVAAVTIGSYERADRNPAVATLVRILSAYGLEWTLVDNGELARRREAKLRSEIDVLRTELQQIEATKREAAPVYDPGYHYVSRNPAPVLS